MTRRRNFVWALAVLALAIGSQASADDTEVRRFTIRVDGNPAGSYAMTVAKKEDGTVIMTGKASVTVNALLRKYVYTYDGREVWKNGRLLQLRSHANDDGKRYVVNAEAVKNGLRVNVNELEREVRWDVWTTSYWQLPDKRFVNASVPLIDADNGKTYNGELRAVGSARILVAGQYVDCQHYRVTGGPSNIDLWFDKSNRLVRQDFVEQNHRTILELNGIQR